MRFFGPDINTSKVEKLKGIPIFHELTRAEILEMDELLHERVYEKGEILFDEGDAGHGLYIVVSGKFGIKPGGDWLRTAVVEFGTGELVGELSLFEEAPRFAKVFALERTTAVALFKAEFFTLLMKNKSIGVKVLLEIARSLSSQTRRLLDQQKHVPAQ